MPQLA